jgi:sodium-dependent dicarboxylate transporter 2/3/5
MSDDFAATRNIDWKKMGYLFLGMALFAVVNWSPAWPDAVDPMGKHFLLSREAKGAIAVFLLAGTWWVFEVVPIGVTSLAIGVLQSLFLMVPSVMFIFASMMIGFVFTKTGLTKRLAYKMLIIVGEKTSMIYLGCFVVTSALTHIMAHTAVAATIYPLLISIYALYGEGDKKTKFGKGLFIGMAYVAGAGSIVSRQYRHPAGSRPRCRGPGFL